MRKKEMEKKVKDYGAIMESCFVEAARVTAAMGYCPDPELCRQIAHDLFVAVNGEYRKSAELEFIGNLKEVAESFKKSDDPFL